MEPYLDLDAIAERLHNVQPPCVTACPEGWNNPGQATVLHGPDFRDTIHHYPAMPGMTMHDTDDPTPEY